MSEQVRPADWPKSGLYWHLHHDRLIEWTDDIDERWDYVVSEKAPAEVPTRLHRMRPVVGPLPAEWSKAYIEWSKADAKWKKAYAERNKADAKWDKAYAKWSKADAESDETAAERNKADAGVSKAYIEWSKADAKWSKADAEWSKADADPGILAMHARECPDCPWDGETIFPKGGKR